MTSVSPPSERSEPFLPPANEVSVGGSTPKGGGGLGGVRRSREGFLPPARTNEPQPAATAPGVFLP